MKTSALLLLTALPLAAQLGPSLLGVYVASEGELIRVEGIPGGLRCTREYHPGALSAAASHRLVLWKTDQEIEASDGRRWTAPPGPAHFIFDPQGEPLAVWFGSTHTLARFEKTKLHHLRVSFSGSLRAFAALDRRRAALLLDEENSTRKFVIDLETGALLEDQPAQSGQHLSAKGELVAVPAPASILTPEFLLLHRKAGPVLFRLADAAEFTLPEPEPEPEPER